MNRGWSGLWHPAASNNGESWKSSLRVRRKTQTRRAGSESWPMKLNQEHRGRGGESTSSLDMVTESKAKMERGQKQKQAGMPMRSSEARNCQRQSTRCSGVTSLRSEVHQSY
jgi:hypothetical protein